MQLLHTIAETRAALRQLRAHGNRVALVPTMGALHAGHLSLVTRARAEAEIVAASIFVNPLQFGPTEDFTRYPRTLEADCALFAQAGVDLVFAPNVAEMVPADSATTIDPGPLGDRLDGISRPGHFRGVSTIVAKLFHILQPDLACFGQKDSVQLAVLRQMVRDLNFPVQILACPIVRDPDGLALSSRNAYLTPAERLQALSLSQTLNTIQSALAEGQTNWPTLRAAALANFPVPLEYLEAVHPDTLLPVPTITPGTLIAIAARIGTTRLIDNFLA